MLDMLVKFIFTIVTKLFSIIISPIVSVITALFPDFSTITTTIINFLNNQVFDYISFLVHMLENLVFLPHWLLVFLFNYYVIKVTIYVTIQGVRFGLAVYNKLKP